MPAMRIDLQLTGLKVVNDMARLARQTKAAADQFERLQKAVNGMNGGGGAGVAAPTFPGVNVLNQMNVINSFNRQMGQASPGGPARSTQNFLQGPHQKLLRAQQNYARALHTRNRAIIEDARLALEQAERRVNALNPSFASRLLELIGTTRIGAGGAMPLINRIGNLVTGASPGGNGANGALAGLAITGVGVAATAAVSAIQAFTRWTMEAAQAASAFKGAMLESGGTVRDTAALRVLGVSVAEVNALRNKLSSDPLAMAVGGAQMDPRLGGNQNNARLYFQKVEELRVIYQQQGATAALTRARILEMEGAMKWAAASERLWKGIQRDIQTTDAIQQRYGASLSELDGQMGRFQQSIENLKTSVVGNIAPQASSGINVATNAANAVAGNPKASQVLGVFVDQFVSNLPAIGDLWRGIKLLGNFAPQTNPQNAAQNANTAAIQQLTATIKQQLGGGPRAGGAIPPALRNAANLGAMRNAALDLRAYRL